MTASVRKEANTRGHGDWQKHLETIKSRIYFFGWEVFFENNSLGGTKATITISAVLYFSYFRNGSKKHTQNPGFVN